MLPVLNLIIASLHHNFWGNLSLKIAFLAKSIAQAIYQEDYSNYYEHC